MWQSKKLSIMKREYTEIRESVKNNMEKNQREILAERFEFRQILPREADQAVEMEQICFPPHEACTEEHMKDRIEKAPSLFLVAMDRETGKLAGLFTGLSTNEDTFRDEFFVDADLYEPEGKNVMMLSLEVLPEYQGMGIARKLVEEYCRREKENGREQLILTCLDAKVEMYRKMGFIDLGISGSTWGNEEWHDMSYRLR